MITRKEFEDYIYSDDVDFDIDTWGDIKFVACQEFLVEYINKQLTQKDAEIKKLRELLVEACEIQSCNCDMSGTVDFGTCDGCHFLNKPEIKQLTQKDAEIAKLESILLTLAKETHKSKELYDWFCGYDKGGDNG